MSRPELDGFLAALCKLKGGRPGKKDADTSATKRSFKSLRKKRNNGKPR